MYSLLHVELCSIGQKICFILHVYKVNGTSLDIALLREKQVEAISIQIVHLARGQKLSVIMGYL